MKLAYTQTIENMYIISYYVHEMNCFFKKPIFFWNYKLRIRFNVSKNNYKDWLILLHLRSLIKKILVAVYFSGK